MGYLQYTMLFKYSTYEQLYLQKVYILQVSTAVRLCDGAIVVVDVVEGVCPQVRYHV